MFFQGKDQEIKKYRKYGASNVSATFTIFCHQSSSSFTLSFSIFPQYSYMLPLRLFIFQVNFPLLLFTERRPYSYSCLDDSAVKSTTSANRRLPAIC